MLAEFGGPNHFRGPRSRHADIDALGDAPDRRLFVQALEDGFTCCAWAQFQEVEFSLLSCFSQEPQLLPGAPSAAAALGGTGMQFFRKP